jgi:tetratricopeptide (TPR) repeat protein
MVTEIGGAAEQPFALRSLAGIDHLQGRSDSAVRHLKEAADYFQTQSMNYEYAETLDTLGGVYDDMGMPDEAQDAWRESVEIMSEIDPPAADRIRARLRGPGR